MSARTDRTNGRALVLGICVLAAVAYLVIGLSRGEPGLAYGGCGVMLAYGVVLLALGRRSEPIALLGGHLSDERQSQVVLKASATTAQVLIVVLVGGAMTTLAMGSQYAGTFCSLCAVGGVTFVASTFWFSRRS